MQLGRTIRLWPTRQQAAQFSRYAGTARFAWNESLAYCKRQQALTGRLPSELECRHHLADLRETTHPWLRDIPEAITKRAVKDLHSAYVKAFRNAKAGHMVGKSGNPYGFPRFRKRGKGTEGFDGLAVRQWTCSDCGTVHDRDLNAALNLASLA